MKRNSGRARAAVGFTTLFMQFLSHALARILLEPASALYLTMGACFFLLGAIRRRS